MNRIRFEWHDVQEIIKDFIVENVPELSRKDVGYVDIYYSNAIWESPYFTIEIGEEDE